MKSRFYVLMSILVVLSLILSSTLVVFAAENNLDEKAHYVLPLKLRTIISFLLTVLMLKLEKFQLLFYPSTIT